MTPTLTKQTDHTFGTASVFVGSKKYSDRIKIVPQEMRCESNTYQQRLEKFSMSPDKTNKDSDTVCVSEYCTPNTDSKVDGNLTSQLREKFTQSKVSNYKANANFFKKCSDNNKDKKVKSITPNINKSSKRRTLTAKEAKENMITISNVNNNNKEFFNINIFNASQNLHNNTLSKYQTIFIYLKEIETLQTVITQVVVEIYPS